MASNLLGKDARSFWTQFRSSVFIVTSVLHMNWKLHRFFRSPPTFYLLIITNITLLSVGNDRQNKRFIIIHDPVIHILSVCMVCQVVLCKLMQVLWSLRCLQGVKWHTLRFLMEGFWALRCTPSCLVLKARKRRYITVIIKCLTAWKHQGPFQRHL